MSSQQISKAARVTLKYFLISGLLVVFGLTSFDRAFGKRETFGVPQTSGFLSIDPQVSTDLDQLIFLPLISTMTIPSKFGVEVYPPRSDMFDFMNDLDSTWIRADIFEWRAIEPVRLPTPQYHWEVVDDAYLEGLSANNKTVIATIRHTPEWAQMIEGHDCGPIAVDSLDEFAQFVGALVERYSVPPYNVKYWEFGNEPDVDPDYTPPDSDIGCWGDETDPYYGGEYYATMLQHVYPAVKAADPNSKVLNGGLLLDCDPEHPNPNVGECLPGTFFEGVLRNGGGQYLDIVSFHGYAFYYSGLLVDENYPSWDARGGVVLGKIDFLLDLMDQYNVSKPLMMTEAGLRCPWYYSGNTSCSPPGDDFYERQADYVVWLYVRNWNTAAINTIWFPLNYADWQYTELIRSNNLPKPAYYAYRFLVQELERADFVRELDQYPGLRAYEFISPGKYIWVLWSPDLMDHVITLPGSVIQILDKYGNVLTPTGNQITVNSPIYIEITR
jgi:hypothetical protein